jgi:hypothetical protein
MRSAVVLLALFGLVATSQQVGGGSSETFIPAHVIRGQGLSIGIPVGWDGRIYESDTGLKVVQAASVRLVDDHDDTGSQTIQAMGSDGIIVSVWYWTDWPPPGRGGARDSIALPLQISRSDFGDFGCYADRPAPATAMRGGTVDGHLIQTVVFFGTESPSDDAIAQANSVLASLTIR